MALNASLSCSPSSLKEGANLTINASGWPAYAYISCTIYDSSGSEMGYVDISAGSTGKGSVTFGVSDPPGTYKVVGSYWDEDEYRGQAYYTVTAASGGGGGGGRVLNASLSCSPSSLSPGSNVTINASGWPAYANVTLSIKDSIGNVVRASSIACGATGTGSVAFAVGSAGSYTVAGTSWYDIDQYIGQSSYTVTGRVLSASLSCSPSSLSKGANLTINASGWPAYAYIDISITNSSGVEVSTYGISCGATGTGSITFTEDNPAGTYTASGTSWNDSDKYVGQSSYTVTAVQRKSYQITTYLGVRVGAQVMNTSNLYGASYPARLTTRFQFLNTQNTPISGISSVTYSFLAGESKSIGFYLIDISTSYIGTLGKLTVWVELAATGQVLARTTIDVIFT
jgi:hypothetical protein